MKKAIIIHSVTQLIGFLISIYVFKSDFEITLIIYLSVYVGFAAGLINKST